MDDIRLIVRRGLGMERGDGIST